MKLFREFEFLKFDFGELVVSKVRHVGCAIVAEGSPFAWYACIKAKALVSHNGSMAPHLTS